MQENRPLDIAKDLERLEGMAYQAAVTYVSQHAAPSLAAGREFVVAAATQASPYEAPNVGQAPTPVGALAALIAATPTKSGSSEYVFNSKSPSGSASTSAQVPYYPYGPYNPIAASSPTKCYKDPGSETQSTQPVGVSTKIEHNATSVRMLTYNPLQPANQANANAADKSSAIDAANQSAIQHRPYAAGNSTAYNPLQQQATSTTCTPESVSLPFKNPCSSEAIPSTNPDPQSKGKPSSSGTPLQVPVPIPIVVKESLESSNMPQTRVLVQPVVSPVGQVPLVLQKPQFRPFLDTTGKIPPSRASCRLAGLLPPVSLVVPPPSPAPPGADAKLAQAMVLPAGRLQQAQAQAAARSQAQLQAESQVQQQQQRNEHDSEQMQPPTTDPEVLRSQVEFLHEMVGGRADVATCRDVLTQVSGDMERASHVMLEMYGGGDGGSATAAAASGSKIGDAVAVEPDGGFSEGDPYRAHDAGPLPPDADSPGGGHPQGAETSEFYSDRFFVIRENIDVRQSSPQQQQQWGSWGDGTAAANAHAGSGTWASDTATSRVPMAAAVNEDDRIWEEDGDAAQPWAVGGRAGGGTEAVRMLMQEVEADGIFRGRRLQFGQMVDGVFVAGPPAGQVGEILSGGSHGVDEEQVAGANDSWDVLAQQPPEDEAAEKMEELRIYFPNLDEDTLRTHLMFFNGDVQQALQLLSELHEDEIYRRVEMERQAESDAALARKLAEQQHALGSLSASTSIAEDYLVNITEELGSQLHRMGVSNTAGATTSGGDGSLLQRSGGHWGVKLLVHIFGGDVDEDLLAEVLANQGGNVDAARAVLRNMGLSEQQQPQAQTARNPLRGVDASGAAGPSTDDPWLRRDEPLVVKGTASSLESSAEDVESTLVSRRCVVPEHGADGVGGLAARVPSTGNLNATRPSGFPQQNQQQGPLAVMPSRHGGGLQPQPQQPQQPQPQQYQQQLGPIRLLASLGLDFQELGFSEEALQCIRVACHNSTLTRLLQRSEATSAQEVLERQRPGAGRPDRGLTHEGKQALWAQHRELPLALKEMQGMLRRGAQAAYETGTPDSKRLAAELRKAACALDGIIKEQHRKASAHIYADMNAALRQQWKTDLHAQLPVHVPMHLDRVFRNLYEMGGNVDWLIITGKGLHSRGDGPKLPCIVEEWLSRHGLDGVPQPGAILVRLTPEVLARVGAKARLLPEAG